MKYCTHCGSEVHEEAEICMKCGCRVKETPRPVNPAVEDDTMETVIKAFLIVGCISHGWLLIPLAWCIPITISVFKSLKEHRPVSTGMKVCTLLLVSLVSGICLFCMDESKR